MANTTGKNTEGNGLTSAYNRVDIFKGKASQASHDRLEVSIARTALRVHTPF
jgi:hypothetical protein